jgi:arylsulfatase A-like enzyme
MASSLTLARAANAPRPNVVFVMTDDQRWDSMSCMGHPYLKTPNIDRLAHEGVMFQNAFATTPLCSPSRASFLTGTMASKHRVVNNAEHGPLSHELKTYQRLLQKADYETAFIGKLHMGAVDDMPRPGIDHWVSFKGQGRFPDPELNFNGERRQVPGYLTDILNQEAVNYIRRRRSKPFNLCVWHKAVHDPTIPAVRHASAFESESIPRRPNYEDSLEGKPGMAVSAEGKPISRRPHGGPAEAKIKNQMRCLLSVDEGVGMMLDALQETKQLDNTLFVFSSDNGYFWGEHRLGDKRRAYEEGLRIPLLMRYPRLIRAGTRPAGMALNIDLAPTFLDLAGVRPPADIDGRSLVPLLKAPPEKKVDWRKSFVSEYYPDPGYLQTPPWRALRTDRWKYIAYPGIKDSEELYDLQADPYEMKNLVGDSKAEKIRAQLQKELAKAAPTPIT